MLGGVICPPEVLDGISRIASEHNVRSLRADLAIVRASIAHAALDRSNTVREEHVQAVLPLVLAHRAKNAPDPPSSSTPPRDTERQEPNGGTLTGERIYPPRLVEMPRVVASGPDSSSRLGPVITSRATPNPAELDARASIVHALAQTGAPIPRREDFYEKVREPRSPTRYLFVVDSSGSHGVKDRMRLVKGAVAGLMEASSGNRDEVCVIAFRGPAAEIVMEPTRDRDAARHALEYLPTGGRTPLANGLELALQYVTPFTILVVLTDGRANVPSKTGDAWADALLAAKLVHCPALVIDTENAMGATGRPAALAEAMNARHVKLDALAAGEELIVTLLNLR
jgi:magnesium chelatase subunit D